MRIARSVCLALTALAIAGPAAAQSPSLDVRTSWIGNSLPGAEGWVQQDIAAMAVADDGAVYTNVYWDEAGGEASIYRDGRVLGAARHTHGWGYHGGRAVAINNRYVFIAQAADSEGGGLRDPATWPPKGTTWQGVSRRRRDDFTEPAPFPGGKGGKGDTLAGSFLVVAEATDGGERSGAAIAGLAATADRLYVSNPSAGSIDLHDAETMERLDRWPVDRPGPLAIDDEGALWTLRIESPAALVRLSSAGSIAATIPLPADAVPTALAAAPGGRLLVADAGPANRIRIYSREGEVGAFGAEGGIRSGVRGRFDALKFNRPTAVGADAAGNLYVASDGQSGGGGTVLEGYAPDGALRWRLFGLTFVDMADLDPGSPADVFTKEEHFRLDLDAEPGADWSYRGYTIDERTYPEDPRLHIWSAGAWVRRIEGRRFLFVNDMNAEYLQVYRFDEDAAGEVAIPSGFFAKRHVRSEGDPSWPPHQPERGAWIWRDRDGDGAFDPGEYDAIGEDLPAAQGWWVDALGNVWLATETAGLRRFPMTGLDADGNPSWSSDAVQTFPHPDGFEQVKRLRYDHGTDALYLGGTTAEHRNQHWKPMGPVIARYDGPIRAGEPLPEPTWRLVAPYAEGSQGHSSCEPMGFDLAGDFLFVPYTGAARETGFTTGHVEVFRRDDGASVGHFEPPPAVGEIGLQDIRECLTARSLPDGTILVFLEDDAKAKVLVYRWSPR